MRALGLMACAALGVALAHPAMAAEGGHMPAPIVFFDIAGPDMAKQAAFYRTVFDWDIRPDGGAVVPPPTRWR